MERYYEIMERLSNTLVLSLGRGFGYDDVAIKARFSKGNHTLRLPTTPPDGHYLRAAQMAGRRPIGPVCNAVAVWDGRSIDEDSLFYPQRKSVAS